MGSIPITCSPTWQGRKCVIIRTFSRSRTVTSPCERLEVADILGKCTKIGGLGCQYNRPMEELTKWSSGGIGRHGSLRDCCPKGYAGSNPALTTNEYEYQTMSGATGRRTRFRFVLLWVRIPPYRHYIAVSGGIGRRACFRSKCPKGRAGSTPASPT